MIPAYVPTLKSLASEFEASEHLDDAHAAVIHPLFDIPVVSENRRKAKKFRESTTPVSDYLDEIVDKTCASWRSGPLLVDAFNWAPDATVETGEHALAYVIGRFGSKGADIVPVFGYVLWDDPIYRVAMCGLDLSRSPYICLRLDSSAIDDAKEPELFRARVEEILGDLDVPSGDCAVLVDFGDLTNRPLPEIIDDAIRVMTLLDVYGFRYLVTSGSSMPKSVDLAVKKQDSTASVVRKEMLLWQLLRTEHPTIPLVFGDYGVRGPGSNEGIPNPNANAKIRYTCNKAFLVSRGHSVSKDAWAAQMPKVAAEIVRSKEFTPGLSWGDRMIADCSSGLPVKNGHGKWIAYDTSHHLAFVVEEVREFERALTRTAKTPLVARLPLL